MDKIEIPIGFKDDGSQEVAIRKANAALEMMRRLGDDIKAFKKQYGEAVNLPSIANALYDDAIARSKAANLDLQVSEGIIRNNKKVKQSISDVTAEVIRAKTTLSSSSSQAPLVSNDQIKLLERRNTLLKEQAELEKNSADGYRNYKQQLAASFNDMQALEDQIEARRALKQREILDRQNDPLGVERRAQRYADLIKGQPSVPESEPLSNEEIAELKRSRDEATKKVRAAQLEALKGFVGKDVLASQYASAYRNILAGAGGAGGGGRGPGGGGAPPGGGDEPPDDPFRDLREQLIRDYGLADPRRRRGGRATLTNSKSPITSTASSGLGVSTDEFKKLNLEFSTNARGALVAAKAQDSLASSLHRTGAAAKGNVDHIVRNAAALTNLRRVGLLVGQVAEGPLSQLGYAAAGGLAFAGIAGIAFVARAILNDVEETKKTSDDLLKEASRLANLGRRGDLQERAKGRSEITEFAESIRQREAIGESTVAINRDIQQKFKTEPRLLTFGERFASELSGLYPSNPLVGGIHAAFNIPGALARAAFTQKLDRPGGVRDADELEKEAAALKKAAEAEDDYRESLRATLKAEQDVLNRELTDVRSPEELRSIQRRQRDIDEKRKVAGLDSLEDPYIELQRRSQAEFEAFKQKSKTEAQSFAKFQSSLFNELKGKFAEANSYLVSKNPYAQIFIEANAAIKDFKQNYDFLEPGTKPISAGGEFKKRLSDSGEYLGIYWEPDKAEEVKKGISDVKFHAEKEYTDLVNQTKRIKLFEADFQQFKVINDLKQSIKQAQENPEVFNAYANKKSRELLEFASSQQGYQQRIDELRGGGRPDDIRKIINQLSETPGLVGKDLSKAIVDATSKYSGQQLRDAGVAYIVQEAVANLASDERLSRAFKQEPAQVQSARELIAYTKDVVGKIGELNSPEARAKAIFALQDQVATLRGISPEDLPPDLLQIQVQAMKDLQVLQLQARKDGETLAKAQVDINASLIKVIQDLPKQIEGVNIVELRDEAPLGVFKTTFVGARNLYLENNGQ